MGNIVRVLTNKTYDISLFSQESPPLSRNAPMVSGAISWARGLLRKIEEPMKIFKENKFITSLRVCAIFVVPVFSSVSCSLDIPVLYSASAQTETILTRNASYKLRYKVICKTGFFSGL